MELESCEGWGLEEVKEEEKKKKRDTSERNHSPPLLAFAVSRPLSCFPLGCSFSLLSMLSFQRKRNGPKRR